LGYNVWALVRARDKVQARQRLSIRFARSNRKLPRNVIPVIGDIRESSWGIGQETMLFLQEECSQIIHIAGETSFKSNGSCYSINLTGVQRIVEEGHYPAKKGM
jgi:thioester reductase-like protein